MSFSGSGRVRKPTNYDEFVVKEKELFKILGKPKKKNHAVPVDVAKNNDSINYLLQSDNDFQSYSSEIIINEAITNSTSDLRPTLHNLEPYSNEDFQLNRLRDETSSIVDSNYSTSIGKQKKGKGTRPKTYKKRKTTVKYNNAVSEQKIAKVAVNSRHQFNQINSKEMNDFEEKFISQFRKGSKVVMKPQRSLNVGAVEVPSMEEGIRRGVSENTSILLDWSIPEVKTIGSLCKVYWEGESTWFYARILNYDGNHRKHYIFYPWDNTVEWISLKNETAIVCDGIVLVKSNKNASASKAWPAQSYSVDSSVTHLMVGWKDTFEKRDDVVYVEYFGPDEFSREYSFPSRANIQPFHEEAFPSNPSSKYILAVNAAKREQETIDYVTECVMAKVRDSVYSSLTGAEWLGLRVRASTHPRLSASELLLMDQHKTAAKKRDIKLLTHSFVDKQQQSTHFNLVGKRNRYETLTFFDNETDYASPLPCEAPPSSSEPPLDFFQLNGSAYCTGTIRKYCNSLNQHFVVFDDPRLQPQWISISKTSMEVLIGIQEDGSQFPPQPPADQDTSDEYEVCQFCSSQCSSLRTNGHSIKHSIRREAMDVDSFQCETCSKSYHTYCMPVEKCITSAQDSRQKSHAVNYSPSPLSLCWDCLVCFGCGKSCAEEKLIVWNTLRVEPSGLDKPIHVCGNCLYRYKHIREFCPICLRLYQTDTAAPLDAARPAAVPLQVSPNRVNFTRSKKNNDTSEICEVRTDSNGLNGSNGTMQRTGVDEEFDDIMMINCNECSKWVHAGCEGIDREQYIAMTLGTHPVWGDEYFCPLCRVLVSESLVERLSSLDREHTLSMFATPVTREMAVNYLDVIRNPMDLSTMALKASHGDYKASRAVRQDFELMCLNALVYNRTGDEYWKSTLSFYLTATSKVFETLSRPCSISAFGVEANELVAEYFEKNSFHESARRLMLKKLDAMASGKDGRLAVGWNGANDASNSFQNDIDQLSEYRGSEDVTYHLRNNSQRRHRIEDSILFDPLLQSNEEVSKKSDKSESVDPGTETKPLPDEEDAVVGTVTLPTELVSAPDPDSFLSCQLTMQSSEVALYVSCLDLCMICASSDICCPDSSSLTHPPRNEPEYIRLKKKSLRGIACIVKEKETLIDAVGWNGRLDSQDLVDTSTTFLFCAECGEAFHSFCIDAPFARMTFEMRNTWRCVNCKLCEVCGFVCPSSQPIQEGPMANNKPSLRKPKKTKFDSRKFLKAKVDKQLLLCEQCDKGFHICCVTPSMPEIPSETWYCHDCVSCTSCKEKSMDASDMKKRLIAYHNSNADGDHQAIRFDNATMETVPKVWGYALDVCFLCEKEKKDSLTKLVLQKAQRRQLSELCSLCQNDCLPTESIKCFGCGLYSHLKCNPNCSVPWIRDRSTFNFLCATCLSQAQLNPDYVTHLGNAPKSWDILIRIARFQRTRVHRTQLSCELIRSKWLMQQAVETTSRRTYFEILIQWAILRFNWFEGLFLSNPSQMEPPRKHQDHQLLFRDVMFLQNTIHSSTLLMPLKIKQEPNLILFHRFERFRNCLNRSHILSETRRKHGNDHPAVASQTGDPLSDYFSDQSNLSLPWLGRMAVLATAYLHVTTFLIWNSSNQKFAIHCTKSPSISFNSDQQVKSFLHGKLMHELKDVSVWSPFDNSLNSLPLHLILVEKCFRMTPSDAMAATLKVGQDEVSSFQLYSNVLRNLEALKNVLLCLPINISIEPNFMDPTYVAGHNLTLQYQHSGSNAGLILPPIAALMSEENRSDPSKSIQLVTEPSLNTWFEWVPGHLLSKCSDKGLFTQSSLLSSSAQSSRSRLSESKSKKTLPPAMSVPSVSIEYPVRADREQSDPEDDDASEEDQNLAEMQHMTKHGKGKASRGGARPNDRKSRYRDFFSFSYLVQHQGYYAKRAKLHHGDSDRFFRHLIRGQSHKQPFESRIVESMFDAIQLEHDELVGASMSKDTATLGPSKDLVEDKSVEKLEEEILSPENRSNPSGNKETGVEYYWNDPGEAVEDDEESSTDQSMSVDMQGKEVEASVSGPTPLRGWKMYLDDKETVVGNVEGNTDYSLDNETYGVISKTEQQFSNWLDPRICGLCHQNGSDSVVGRYLSFSDGTFCHANCVRWCTGVYESGNTLFGATEAVNRYSKVSCSLCGQTGAGVACCEWRCRRIFHLKCALAYDMVLIESTTFVNPITADKRSNPTTLLEERRKTFESPHDIFTVVVCPEHYHSGHLVGNPSLLRRSWIPCDPPRSLLIAENSFVIGTVVHEYESEMKLNPPPVIDVEPMQKPTVGGESWERTKTLPTTQSSKHSNKSNGTEEVKESSAVLSVAKTLSAMRTDKAVRCGAVTIFYIGKPSIEDERFHSEAYIYPHQFRSSRIFWSTKKPITRTLYVFEILSDKDFKIDEDDDQVQSLQNEIATSMHLIDLELQDATTVSPQSELSDYLAIFEKPFASPIFRVTSMDCPEEVWYHYSVDALYSIIAHRVRRCNEKFWKQLTPRKYVHSVERASKHPKPSKNSEVAYGVNSHQFFGIGLPVVRRAIEMIASSVAAMITLPPIVAYRPSYYLPTEKKALEVHKMQSSIKMNKINSVHGSARVEQYRKQRSYVGQRVTRILTKVVDSNDFPSKNTTSAASEWWDDQRIEDGIREREHNRMKYLGMLNSHISNPGGKLEVKRSPIHGWGLFAKIHFEKNDMIVEYIGERIRQVVADRREEMYEVEGVGSCYLFRLDKDDIVDATRQGGMARFINHCCEPNAYARILSTSVEEEVEVDPIDQKHIIIMAARDIQEGEEITYDYKFPIEDVKLKCYCGAPKCQGSMN